MICISVTPESRKLAKADLLNASRHCDLIELCLDKLIKEPDIGEMISGIDKPILISCRRQEDGGKFKGTEEERQALLRQAIIAGPAYIELELDIAKKIPRFGETQRVISYTSLDEPLGNVESIINQARQADADVVKFTWPTPTLDAAWPLLAAVTKKREVSVVGMGLGRPGLTFALLGRKYGSPWVYAALEKGMEAHEGQGTVWELNELYNWNDISPQTKFVGVVGGFGEAGTTAVKALNAAFKALELDVCCLPLELGGFDKLDKMLDILKVAALVVTPRRGTDMLDFAGHIEEDAEQGRYADLLLKQPDGWHAYNTIWRSTLKAIETVLGRQSSEDRPLDRRNVLVIGAGGLAHAVAHGIHRRKGVLSIAAPADDQAKKLAQKFDCRHVPFSTLYDTLADVVVIADPRVTMGHRKSDVNPSLLRESMTVADVANLPEETELFREARARGCRLVEPMNVYKDQLATQFKAITGQELPADAVEEAVQSGE